MASTEQSRSRRTVLQAISAVMLGGAVAGCSNSSANSSSSSDGTGGTKSFGGWMEEVGNYDGVVDRTGKSKVTVTVGAKGNGGNFAFSPPAIKVDTGTTVVWKWNGKGGSHNVAESGGEFKSKLTDKKGFTFEQTFDSSGTTKYVCKPHKTMGMKGVVVVVE